MDTSSTPHYICTGECLGVSTKPGVCQAPAGVCSQSGQPLAECNCEDIHNHDPLDLDDIDEMESE